MNFGEDLFLEITCFRPEKSFQSNSRLIWPKILGQVLEQDFESGAMKNFQNENGPWLEKDWEPLLQTETCENVDRKKSWKEFVSSSGRLFA